MNDQFWKRKSLSEMTAAEWESLCDGCGLCCMLKVQDEDTGDVFYTDVACRLFDIETCRCTDYANRAKQVADCLVLTPDEKDAYEWLPDSCAYRRLANGQEGTRSLPADRNRCTKPGYRCRARPPRKKMRTNGPC
jgi:uncharacterized cysteine cluster protein YcgN (CxxCxxCC family)